MAELRIRYRIRPDGVVEELVEGVGSPACELLTESIERQLGSVQQRRSTAEAFQRSTVGPEVQLPVHQHHAV
jgi:hypothetical protein